MYDLATLEYLNEQAHLRAVELANKAASPLPPESTEVKESKPPPVFPLSILARKLQGGPPSLAYFVELLEQTETFKDFLELVRNYVPEHELSIMAEDLNLRAGKFGYYFSQQYFPLLDSVFSEDFTVGDLLNAIPVQLLGFSAHSYHEFADFRDGYILLLSIVECPLADDMDDDMEEGEVTEGLGARIPILEKVSELVGEGLSRLIPPNGWPAEYLHEKTDGTEFEGCGDFADWVNRNTSYMILDTPGEYSYVGEEIQWDPAEVEGLADDWNCCREILDKHHKVALLLEREPELYFQKLLLLLLETKPFLIPKEQLNLPI